MIELGKVIKTFSATNESSGLPRPIVSKLNLIVDYGIENDKFAGKKLDQTVMLVGLKSYEIAKENNIDLIITDINMPNLNGIEMIKEIKKIDRNCDFIFLSANDDSKILLECIP